MCNGCRNSYCLKVFICGVQSPLTYQSSLSIGGKPTREINNVKKWSYGNFHMKLYQPQEIKTWKV